MCTGIDSNLSKMQRCDSAASNAAKDAEEEKVDPLKFKYLIGWFRYKNI